MAEFGSVKSLTILIFDVYLSSNIAHESLLLHSYKRSFNGFAARLTEEEAQKLAGCLMNPTLILFFNLHKH